MDDFRPKEILQELGRRQIAFIVIGGIAAAAHGSPYPTRDVDICPEDTDANLELLAQALVDLDARLMVADEASPISVALSPRILRSAEFFNFVTRWGRLDIVWKPAATAGYRDLSRHAVKAKFGDVEVRIAALGDVLRSKSALLRDKDMKTVHVLRELEEQRIQAERRREKDEP